MKKTPIIVAAIFVAGIAGALVEWSNRQSIASSEADRDSYDTRDGKKEAEADIARGNPKWKVSGRVSEPEERAARLKRLGIEMDWFADCLPTWGIVRYRYEYNTVIRAHFVRLLGEETVLDVIGPPVIDDRQFGEEANQPSEPMRAKGPHGSP
jgi:hypothetical protein